MYFICAPASLNPGYATVHEHYCLHLYCYTDLIIDECCLCYCNIVCNYKGANSLTDFIIVGVARMLHSVKKMSTNWSIAIDYLQFVMFHRVYYWDVMHICIDRATTDDTWKWGWFER